MPTEQSLCQDLIETYDDFARFHDSCAFLVESMRALLAETSELDYAIVEGATELSEQVRQNAGELKIKLRRVQENCCSAR